VRDASSLARVCLSVAAMLVAVSLCAVDFRRLDQVALERYGRQGQVAVHNWERFLDTVANLPEEEKLELVNEFINRQIRYGDDIAIFGEKDYWATPLESLAGGAGDCEDFSIAKYITLNLLGVPIEKLRLTYVRAELGRPGSGITQAHMVLAYYAKPTSEPLILDNLVGTLRPASRRKDLKPVYGFNSQGLWVAGQPAPVLADPTSRLSRWRDVLQRMQQEGLL